MRYYDIWLKIYTQRGGGEGREKRRERKRESVFVSIPLYRINIFG